MKYAVIGIGAIGTVIGGLLVESGEEVVLLGRDYQIKKIKNEGIKISGLNKTKKIDNVNISSDIKQISESDIIIISIKSQDTKKLANNLKGNIKESALIVSFQNGVKNAQILRDITGNKVVSGIILFNSLYLKPGEIEITISGDILIENDKSNENNIKNLANNLSKNGIETKIVEKIDGYLFSKLIVNLQIAVTALTGQSVRESIIDTDSRKILVSVMSEGLKVLEKSGISIKPLPDIDPIKMIKRLKNTNTIFLKFGSIFMGVKKNARNSMWQSLDRRKTTEIDFINGEIVNIAKKNNLKAPVNNKLVDLIKEAEKQEIKRTIEPDRLRRILNV